MDLAGRRVKIHPVKEGRDRATHQVLVAEASELLKLLGYEELSAADSTADCPQHYRHAHTHKLNEKMIQ